MIQLSKGEADMIELDEVLMERARSLAEEMAKTGATIEAIPIAEETQISVAKEEEYLSVAFSRVMIGDGSTYYVGLPKETRPGAN
jgi:hypothetical protein